MAGRRSNVRTMPRVGRRVRSFVDPAPGAELLGTVVGYPWTDPSAWLDEALTVRLAPDAVRFAWRVTGQRHRVAVAAEFVSCGAQPCAICDGDCYTHGPYLFEYRHNEGGGVERAPLEKLGRRSPPPTLADVSRVANDWRALHEHRRAEQRWLAVKHEAPPRHDGAPGFDDAPPPDLRGGPRPDFRGAPSYDFRSAPRDPADDFGVPPPCWQRPRETPFPHSGPFDDGAHYRRPRQPSEFDPRRTEDRARDEQRARDPSGRLAQLRDDMKMFDLERGFTREDLKKAHRRLVVELHPDRGGDQDKMAKVNAANDRLAQLFEDSPETGES